MSCSARKYPMQDSQLRGALCGLLFLSVSSQCLAAASPWPIAFGFQLGQTISLPPCPIKKIGLIEIQDALEFTCITPLFERTGQPKEVREIVFPIETAPTIVKGRRLIALENNGKLIGIEFSTRGAASQDYVFSELKAKFGKPTSLDFESMTNGFGAAFRTVFALWQRRDFSVTFSGTFGQIDEGRVLIDLNEATSLREAAAIRDSQKKTPL